MKRYNLIVAGGGLSGVAAAVAAAREGLSVLLVEKSGCLGGAISNNLVYPFMNYWTYLSDAGDRKYLNAGIFEEIRQLEQEYIEQCGEESVEGGYWFRPEYYKILLDEILIKEGVEVLFHATLFDAKTDCKKITGISVVVPSGVIELEGDYFVDATGNGELLKLAGCDFQLGRESDGLCQPMTTCFRMSGVDVEAFKADLSRLQELYKSLQSKGEIRNPRENILVFYGIGKDVVHFNTTRVIKHDPTDAFDVSRAEIEGRRQVYEMVRFLKDNCEAFKNSTIINIANEIGVRESRKLKGVHILTQDELKEMVPFEDSIAVGNYDIDIHNPSGTGTSHYYFGKGEYYRIPYGSLRSEKVDNLLAAGRCISVTHEAQASIRVMPICACIGHAAGTASAVAFNTGTTVHDVDIKKVQEVLVRNGAVID